MSDASIERPRAGMVVRALVDDTTGRRVTANILIDKVTRLGCGCWRLEGIRPGHREKPAAYLDLHLLTGCADHPGQVEREVYRSSYDRQDNDHRVYPGHGVTETRRGGTGCPAGACDEPVISEFAVVVGTIATHHQACRRHRYSAPQRLHTPGATLWQRQPDGWHPIPLLRPEARRPRPVEDGTPAPGPALYPAGEPVTVRFTQLPATAPPGPPAPLDKLLTVGTPSVAELADVFAAHWPDNGTPPRKPGEPGTNWTRCPGCGHVYSLAAPLCPSLATAWPLLARRRHEHPAAVADLRADLARPIPRPAAPADAGDEAGSLFDVTPYQRQHTRSHLG